MYCALINVKQFLHFLLFATKREDPLGDLVQQNGEKDGQAKSKKIGRGVFPFVMLLPSASFLLFPLGERLKLLTGFLHHVIITNQLATPYFDN